MNSNITKEIKQLSENYTNLGKVKTITILEPGNINSINYKIITSKGKYVIRKTLQDYDPKRLLQMCKILNFLNKNKIKVPHPIKNKKNRYFEISQKIYLTQFYEGKFFQGKNKELKDIAKNLAILHKNLEKNKIKYNYDPNSKFFKIITIKELKTIQRIIRNKKNVDLFDKKTSKNIDYLIKQVTMDYKKSNFIKKLNIKKQLIHGDLHPKNVIFSNNKVKVVLDFNSMRNGFKIEDIMFSSFRFGSFYNSNPKKILNSLEIFLQTYLLYNNLDTMELENSHYFLKHMILSRISFLLKKRYFSNSNLWKKDFTKHLNSLKIAEKMNISII